MSSPFERLVGLGKPLRSKSLVREAVADRVAYLKWEEKALAQGQADLDARRVVTTDELRKALSEQRVRRGRKAAKTA